VTEREEAFRAALARLPDPSPRPPGELEVLEQVWKRPQGWRLLTAVNNNIVGVAYVGAALLFFVLGGILSLLMRAQLALPLNELVDQGTYNQLFTMHGTIMMFLFAVPAVEAMGVLLLPQMVGARDLPFPRLSAYAFWAYFVGGLVFFSSIFFGLSPDGGWFMYPPLTSYEYSPGINADFWLLGIGFIEISAIAGAVEIIVGVLKNRAPGMTLDRMPPFAWAMLVFAGMIIVAFPAIILSTILLEVERAFQWPFFLPGKGGDPLLWQHLFWFFGHPEVYIIFIPAAGLISMIVPTLVRAPLVCYRLVVAAFLGTGFISFGVWAHHMFATGLPPISVSYFSAASMAVSIPAGIQVFAWITTLMAGRRVRWNVPALFTIGFLVTFTMGGLTGVMVAMVPFDWQAHDTYFVVAHLHYVLIGGMVFPLFAAIYYWVPMASRYALSERVGRWVFWLFFTGMHVTFLPMHLTGLLGMPRRVYTYLPGMGLETVNLVSTAGAFIIAAGIALFVVDMARRFRLSNDNAGNVYGSGTLEWLPNGNYAARSIPFVQSRNPMWDRPTLADEVEQGRWFLPNAATHRRETLVTSPLAATPEYLLVLPGPAWAPLIAAVFTAAVFILLIFKLTLLSLLCAIVAIGAMVYWVWELDHGPDRPPVEVGGGLKLPVYALGSTSHAIWAAWLLIVVLAMICACLVFAIAYLWSVQPDRWPPPGTVLPELSRTAGVLMLAAASFAMIRLARRGLARLPNGRRRWVVLPMVAAWALLVAAIGGDLAGWHADGVDPAAHSFGASAYTFGLLNGMLACALSVMAGVVVARVLVRRTDSDRRISFDVTELLWAYACAQVAVGVAATHLFPRLVQ
jgi:cytochrome c oxidase subunit I+III